MTIPDTNAVISIIDDAIADSLGPDWNSFQAAHHVMQWLTDAGLQIVPQCSHGRVLAMDNAQVTQKDREAAARIYQNFRDHDYAKWILDGTNAMGDHDPVIQAFARHRLERSEPVGWMGIESAPKDWTDVLVFSPEHEGFNCGGVFSAFYAEGEENCWFAHGPAHNIRLNPTHWQPLPSAPGTTTPEPVAEIERLRELLREALEALKAARPFVNPNTFPGTATPVREKIETAIAALGDAS